MAKNVEQKFLILATEHTCMMSSRTTSFQEQLVNSAVNVACESQASGASDVRSLVI